MTDDQLHQIESALGTVLPQAYRDAMATAGGYTYGGMFNRPETIVAQTQVLRDILHSYEKKCPNSLVVVTEIDGGDLLVIDAADPTLSLLCFDHETLAFSDFKTSFLDFVQSCKDLGI